MTWVMWAIFIAFVVVMLLLDLFVFHRKAHVIKVREALLFSAMWIALAMAFNVLVYFIYERHWFGFGGTSATELMDGRTAAVLWFTGYVIEKSLSVDNIFVIAMVFSYFHIPPKYQHRVLFWGIFGALILRGLMIGLGAVLIERFHWMLYVFGVILILTALKMIFSSHEPDPGKNPMVRLAKRFFPVTTELNGEHFTARQNGVLMLTPLALALVVVEATDVMFAIDSIPAIFAITSDPFLVFTCNVFAILGLRSLYFALAGVMDKFHYLKFSLAVLLALIGVKMLLKDVLHAVPNITYYTLGAIAFVLGAGVVASLVRARREKDAES
ncbi:MAG: TerC family protein [Thermoanaerobaculia bacterium]|nr:TerC family protein [Thermoanaerobaculia bacterium]